MTGGQALVEALVRQGTEVIFGLPGIQLDWLFDALYAEDRVRVIHTRHEQATSYMADGYARTTGKVGTCLVVPGPGLLNAGAGLATAYACSSPVLCIAGQIQTDDIGRGRGVLHEVARQSDAVRSITKWTGMAHRPAEIPALVENAFRQLRSGRPRPVEIEIPPDVLHVCEEVTFVEADVVVAERPAPHSDQVERAAKALGKAKNPLIFAGGGVIASAAWEALRHLAEMLEAPVVMTTNGKGAVDDRHYLAQNMVAAQTLMPESDVVLAVGTRFALPPTCDWGPNGRQRLIQLDIDPDEVGRNHAAAIGIVSDARLGLEALIDRVPRHNRKRPSRNDELVALKEKVDDALFEVQPLASYALTIREEIPDDAIVVNESTQVGYWNWVGFPVYQPRTFVHPGYQGTLGYGFPTALGAQVGNPDRRVISINGDGGFMYNVAGLSTMAQQKLPVIVIIFNDNQYGNVRLFQNTMFGGRTIATDLVNPDFAKLAKLFGIDGVRANGPEGLRQALRRALKRNEPAVIEVAVGEMTSVFPLLLAGRHEPPWSWPGE